jgi:glutamate racemase
MTASPNPAGRDAPIGVFDSGLGGLTVVQYMQKLLPHERIVFVADQAHVPYLHPRDVPGRA